MDEAETFHYIRLPAKPPNAAHQMGPIRLDMDHVNEDDSINRKKAHSVSEWALFSCRRLHEALLTNY